MLSQPRTTDEPHQVNIFDTGMSKLIAVCCTRRARRSAPESSSLGIVLPFKGATLVLEVTKLIVTVES